MNDAYKKLIETSGAGSYWMVDHWEYSKDTQDMLRQNTINTVFEYTVKQMHPRLEDVKETINKWIAIPKGEDEVIDVMLAVAIGEKMGGEPLWLFLVAPPGSAKTELLRTLRYEMDGDYYTLSDLTNHTFVTGLYRGTGKDREKVADLLPELNKKILVMKDFTVILEKGKEVRREIISQLRDIYDGSFAKKLGTTDETIRHNARFGLVAGVTNQIDNHWKIDQQLGERFLKYRIKLDSDEATHKAYNNESMESDMRSEMSDAVMNFLSKLQIVEVTVPAEYENTFVLYADFVAKARTPIAIQSAYSDFYFEQIPTPEYPTRLVKQLKKLAKCLAIVRGRTDVNVDDLATVKRVCLDTIPQDRRFVLDAIAKIQWTKLHSEMQGVTNRDIEVETKIPNASIHKITQALERLGLIKGNLPKDEYGNLELEDGQPHIFWKLDKLAEAFLS